MHFINNFYKTAIFFFEISFIIVMKKSTFRLEKTNFRWFHHKVWLEYYNFLVAKHQIFDQNKRKLNFFTKMVIAVFKVALGLFYFKSKFYFWCFVYLNYSLILKHVTLIIIIEQLLSLLKVTSFIIFLAYLI